ncbi:MAG: ribosome-associated translation inhibitor RaiA, partial [Saprospiraceae bacterium]
NIIVRNNTELSNKHVRFIKWKIYKLKRKFDHLIYAEIHLNVEGNSPKRYETNVRLGVSGHDIIIKNQSHDIREILRSLDQSAHRYLRKRK